MRLGRSSATAPIEKGIALHPLQSSCDKKSNDEALGEGDVSSSLETPVIGPRSSDTPYQTTNFARRRSTHEMGASKLEPCVLISKIPWNTRMSIMER
jgi:hypothetical protein